MADSIRKQKPEKPYEGFPLYAHASGRWAKKISGKLHYFGKWDSPEQALEKLNREFSYLQQGIAPPVTSGGCTIRLLCNSFLTAKESKTLGGEMSQLTFSDYHRACELLVQFFGPETPVESLTPVHFEKFRESLSLGVSKLTLKNRINRIRVVLKYGVEQELTDKAIRYGQGFDRPTSKTLRQEKNTRDERFLERSEILSLMQAADTHMRAMILLGLNCGYGNNDCSHLEFKHLSQRKGWAVFPRLKTEIERECPLWPETILSLEQSISDRPKPNNDTNVNLVFITIQGNAWLRSFASRKTAGKTSTTNTVAKNFRLTMGKAGISRPGIGFYTLRHVFETIAGECRDQVAVDSLMGHSPKSDDMASVYRHRISDSRLHDAVNTVRKWLWPESA